MSSLISIVKIVRTPHYCMQHSENVFAQVIGQVHGGEAEYPAGVAQAGQPLQFTREQLWLASIGPPHVPKRLAIRYVLGKNLVYPMRVRQVVRPYVCPMRASMTHPLVRNTLLHTKSVCQDNGVGTHYAYFWQYIQFYLCNNVMDFVNVLNTINHK